MWHFKWNFCLFWAAHPSSILMVCWLCKSRPATESLHLSPTQKSPPFPNQPHHHQSNSSSSPTLKTRGMTFTINPIQLDSAQITTESTTPSPVYLQLPMLPSELSFNTKIQRSLHHCREQKKLYIKERIMIKKWQVLNFPKINLSPF